MAWFACLEQLPARPLIFSFGSGVTFGPGRGTAGGRSVTPCQGVFLIRRVSCGLVCVPGTIACQTLDCFIRFRSDVWPGQRDGRRLFRHAVPGCFPDSMSCGLVSVPGTIACQTLDFSFGSGVTFGPGRGTAGGCSVTPCQGVFLIRRASCGLVCVPGTIACQTLDFSFGSGVTFGPGRGTAGGCSVTPCQGVFLIRRVSCGLVCVPGTIACQTLDFSFGSGVTFGLGRGTAGGRSVTPCQGLFLI